MEIKTTFSCGDKGWVFDGAEVRQRTIGQIRIEYTHSPGIGDGFMEGGVISYSGGSSEPENYAEMNPTLIESYMCVETGIGSGSIYTLGKSIFVTREECEVVCAERIEKKRKEDEESRQWRKEDAKRRLEAARRELARLEAQVATA